MQVVEDPRAFGVALPGYVEARVLGLDGEADRAGDQGDGREQLCDHSLLPGLGSLDAAGLDEQRTDLVAADDERVEHPASGTTGSSSPSTICASRLPLAVATMRAALPSRSRGSVWACRSAVITATSAGEMVPLP